MSVARDALRDALALTRDALTFALSGLGSSAPGGVHWRVFPLDAPRKLPAVVIQPQESGRADVYVGAVGWTGLVIIKALAPTEAAAEACIRNVSAALPRDLDYGDYRITIVLDRPVLLPIAIGQSAMQAGLQYQITIHRRVSLWLS